MEPAVREVLKTLRHVCQKETPEDILRARPSNTKTAPGPQAILDEINKLYMCIHANILVSSNSKLWNCGGPLTDPHFL